MNGYRSPVARWLLGGVLFLGPWVAHAEVVGVDAQTGNTSFAQRRAMIEKALASGKQYAEISHEDRKQVLQALERMSGLLQQAPSVAELPTDAAAAVQRDQAFVNEVLARAESDSELRCSTQMALGSNIRSRSCETAAAKKRREAEQAANGPPRLDVIR